LYLFLNLPRMIVKLNYHRFMSLFIFIEAILVWLVFGQMNPGLCQIVFRLQSLGVLVRGREVVIH